MGRTHTQRRQGRSRASESTDYGLPSFPDPLNGVELRAVGRHEQQRKALLTFVAPCPVQASMMVSDIVQDHHDPAPGTAGEPPQLFQKREERVRVEPVNFTAVNELPVPDADGAKVADALPVNRHSKFTLYRHRKITHPCS